MQFLVLVSGILSALKTGFNAAHSVFTWVGSASNTAGPMFMKSIITGLTVASVVAHTGSVFLAGLAGVLTTIGSFLSRI
jgi:hypothetical protein